MLVIKKRNGEVVPFDASKIAVAVEKAMAHTEQGIDSQISRQIAEEIKQELEKQKDIKGVEDIQDMVEYKLMKVRPDAAKKYILYREKRNQIRQHGWDMTELQRSIYKNKYEYNSEGFYSFVTRVSGGNEKIAKLIRNKKFLPAGRILAGRGLHKHGKKITYSNCYVIPAPEDNLESIFDTAKYLARTYSYGGGCGVDISKLRPRNAAVNNAAKKSTGAVSFMDLFDLTTSLIAQKGRRGALMISLHCTHPDIFDFINVKNDLSKVTKANISIRATDEFMRAVKENKDFTLRFEVEATGEVIERTVKARDVLYQIALSNWNMGEPGFLYWDRIEQWNLLYGNKEFKFGGVNPCGEEPLPDFGSCNLCSINLSEYVVFPFTDKAYFDFASFTNDVKEVVNYMDDLLDEGADLHPLPQQRECVRQWRQIGIGIMGLADMLIKLGIRYGSQESFGLCDEIGKVMINAAMQQSAVLAKDKGMYPKCDVETVLSSPFFEHNADPHTRKLVSCYGLRHSQLLTIAPTGSISTMLGVSGGIEPIYEISYLRKTESLHDEETYYKIYTPIVAEYMEIKGIKDEEELPDYFVTAMDIPYEERIKMQAVWQKHIDASISSTVNLPEETTVEDIMNIYIKAWEAGLKGITVFRNGCARAGILTPEKPKQKTEKCPKCGGEIKYTNGCKECKNCGWGACSL